MSNIPNLGRIPNIGFPPKKEPHYLDTLEHLDHAAMGAGFSDKKNNNISLSNKAKNNHFTKQVCRSLSTLNSPLNKAYRITLFDCCTTLIQEGTKITSKYCGYRWCSVCNRIRTAKLIHGYLEPLKKMSQPFFVTLTIPNVQPSELRQSMAKMVNVSSNILRAFKRLKMPCNGIRKLECTYNSIANNFHPHFHFIVDGKNVAHAMVLLWLERYPSATFKAQDYRPIYDTENDVKELFKYTTKIITGIENNQKIYIGALDTIFKAVKAMRTFQPFGNIKKVSEDIEGIRSTEYEDIEPYDFVVWRWENIDWVNMLDGQLLTNYEPSKFTNNLLTKGIII